MTVSILTASGASIQSEVTTAAQIGALAIATAALGGEVMRTTIVSEVTA